MADQAEKDYMKELTQCAHAIGMQGRMYDINNFAAEFGGNLALKIIKDIRAKNQARLDKNMSKISGPRSWEQKIRPYYRAKKKAEKDEQYNAIIQQQKKERQEMEKRGFNPLDFWQRFKQIYEPLRKGVSVMTHNEKMSVEDQMKYARMGLNGAFLSQADALHKQVGEDLNQGKITADEFRARMADLNEVFGQGVEVVGTDFTQTTG